MVEDKSKITARNKFTLYLKSLNLRKTPERFAILDKIFSINDHFDIESLHGMMEADCYHVSRATLYNTLILLINAHLVIKHKFGNASQYEKSYNNTTHHHQICTQCGAVTEIFNEELRHAIEETKLTRFNLSHYTLYLYGWCGKCDRANKRKLKKINTNKKDK